MRRTRRRVLALLVFLAVVTSLAGSAMAAANSAAASATTRVAQRQAIRSMPLLSRPNRPGHVYGNNVRRIYHLRSGRR